MQRKSAQKRASQTILVTKNVWFVEPQHERGYVHKFIARKPGAIGVFNGISTCWWYTRTGYKAIENLAAMLVDSDKSLMGCDLESAAETIKNTLVEICLDPYIFNSSSVALRRESTLFECKAHTDVRKFAEAILLEIGIRLKCNLALWCIAYPAPRLSGPTFQIPEINAHAIEKSDSATWAQVVASKYMTDQWSPETGEFSNKDESPFSKLKYSYVFVAAAHGTQKGAQFAASLNLRKLFSVLYGIISGSNEYRLLKCGVEAHHLSIQFPANGTSGLGIATSGIGKLVPYYIDDIALDLTQISRVQRWFSRQSRLIAEKSNRIDKCAYFVNRAMNSSDIETYINFFVALDALFGVRGSVEESITSGVKKLTNSKKWDEKISWLFDLRNELVHGGSRHIKEWPKYYNYCRHFESDPEADIEKLAFAALLNAPEVIQ